MAYHSRDDCLWDYIYELEFISLNRSRFYHFSGGPLFDYVQFRPLYEQLKLQEKTS